MKKIFSLILAVVAFTSIASAQQAIEQPKWYDNTYVALKGGVNGLMKPKSLGYEDFGHSIEATMNLQIGKWFTPVIGIALEDEIGFENGSNMLRGIGHAGLFQAPKWINYNSLNVLGKINMMNLFNGYKARKFEMIAFGGMGWTHGFEGYNIYESDYLTTKFGLEFNYNINKRFQINVVPSVSYNLSAPDNFQFNNHYGWINLSAGVTYKIGDNFKVSNKKYTQDDFDALNAEINELRSREPQVIERIVEREVVKEVTGPIPYVIVNFEQNSSTLSQDAKNLLDLVTGEVSVTGSASPEGTEKRNTALAKERAQVVAKYLESRGVKVKNVRGIGAAGSRIVIVK